MFLPGGMLGRDVQRVEVIPVGFHLRAFGHGKAHVGEDGGQFFHHLRHRVDRAARAGAAGKRDIQPLFTQAGVKGGIGEASLFGAQRGVNLILQDVQHRAGSFALVGVHLAKTGHQRGNLALLAKGGHAQLFQGSLVRDGGNRCKIFGLQIVKPVHHAPPLDGIGASGKVPPMQEAERGRFGGCGSGRPAKGGGDQMRAVGVKAVSAGQGAAFQRGGGQGKRGIGVRERVDGGVILWRDGQPGFGL